MKTKTLINTAIIIVVIGTMITTATAVPDGYENIDAIWESPNIIVTVDTFQHPLNYYQFRYYQPGTDECSPDNPPDEGPYNTTTNPNGYFVSTVFTPIIDGNWDFNENNFIYTDTFNVPNSGAENTTGEWTVWLFKGGIIGSDPTNAITSDRVYTTVDVPIPEFTTLMIPIIAILGLVVFHRRKQQ